MTQRCGTVILQQPISAVIAELSGICLELQVWADFVGLGSF